MAESESTSSMSTCEYRCSSSAVGGRSESAAAPAMPWFSGCDRASSISTWRYCRSSDGGGGPSQNIGLSALGAGIRANQDWYFPTRPSGIWLLVGAAGFGAVLGTLRLVMGSMTLSSWSVCAWDEADVSLVPKMDE